MFISFGTRVVNRRLGRVADFCPICRDVQPFHVTKIDKYDHIYGIPVSHRGTVGFVKRCESCSVALNEEMGAHECFSRDRAADVATLTATASPGLRERMRRRLSQEKRVRDGGLTTEERYTLLMEPFLCLNPWADDRGRSIEKDRAVTSCLLGALALPFLIVCLLESTRLVSAETEWKAAAAAGIALLFAALYMRITAHGRYARRVLIPRLAQTLRPLRPSPEELEKTIGLLKQKRLRIGKSVDPEALSEAISGPMN